MPSAAAERDDSAAGFSGFTPATGADSGLATSRLIDDLTPDCQISTSSAYSPRKMVIPKPCFITPFERTGANNRAGKLLFLAFLLSKLELITNFFKLKNPKKSFFGKYFGFRDDVGFCVVELTHAVKKESIQQELETSQIIISTPLIISYLTDAKELFKFLYAKEELTHSTYFQKTEKQTFNFEMFNDFAISRNLTNAFTITYEYSEISQNPSSDLHQNFGDQHYENSKLFVMMPDRHRHSISASKVVTAYLTESVAKTSNTNFLKTQINEIYEWWDGPTAEPAEMDAYVQLAEMTRRWHGESKLRNMLTEVFYSYQIGKPKRRWVSLQGKVNCGKTTLAGGIIDLLNGVGININYVHNNRLTFQLGQAIGARYVMFDDVTSIGFRNLNRFGSKYLDGDQKVSLKRKNKAPLQCRFPSGIITTSEAQFPDSLRVSIQNFEFVPNPEFFEAHKAIFGGVKFDKKALVIRKYII